MKKTALFALLLPALPAFAADSGNRLEDMFTVKKIDGKQAVTEGSPNGLKAGDELYFARSPFHFAVTAVAGKEVTIALPEKQDLAVGNTLVRKETPAMRKAISTEGRLKQALDE